MTRPEVVKPSWRQVACPNCHQSALFAPSNPWRPFCSERCRSMDLGAWASEGYRVDAARADPAHGSDPLQP